MSRSSLLHLKPSEQCPGALLSQLHLQRYWLHSTASGPETRRQEAQKQPPIEGLESQDRKTTRIAIEHRRCKHRNRMHHAIGGSEGFEADCRSLQSFILGAEEPTLQQQVHDGPRVGLETSQVNNMHTAWLYLPGRVESTGNKQSNQRVQQAMVHAVVDDVIGSSPRIRSCQVCRVPWLVR